MAQLDVWSSYIHTLVTSSPLDGHIQRVVDSPIKLSKHHPPQQRGGEDRASRDADAHTTQTRKAVLLAGWLISALPCPAPRTTECLTGDPIPLPSLSNAEVLCLIPQSRTCIACLPRR